MVDVTTVCGILLCRVMENHTHFNGKCLRLHSSVKVVLLCMLVAAVAGVGTQLSAFAGRLEALEGAATAAGADARIIYCIDCDIGVYS